MAKRKEADHSRFFTRAVKIRSMEKDGKKYIVGKIPYNSRSVDLGWDFHEILAPGVFAQTLDNGDNVFALRNHNTDEILGSTQAGTLVLEDTESGLICTTELPDTTYANDLFAIVERGDCNTLSFGFCADDVEYTDLGDGTVERTILSGTLEEVSYGVPFPAYPDSDVQAELRNRKRSKGKRSKRDEDEIDEEERDDEELDEEERDDEELDEEQRDEELDEEERDDDELDEEQRDEELDEEERDDDELDEEERDEDELEEERDDEEIDEEERDDEELDEEQRKRSRRKRSKRTREAQAFLFLNRYK